MRLFLLSLPMITLGFSSYSQEAVKFTNTKIVNNVALGQSANPSITYEIITHVDGTYGYEILINDKVFYQQKNFPGKSSGFIHLESAQKTAELIITKIKARKKVPQISNKMLDALGYH